MKHVPSEKYSIAWFKLSECVARGEKERALGVYKLLSYSIDDPAFLLQLEGDLLLAFEDRKSIKKYLEAAWMYKKAQRFIEAAAIYEHLIELQPDSEDHIISLIILYNFLKFTERMHERIRDAVERFSDHDDKKKLNAFLIKLQEEYPEGHKMACVFLKR